MIITKKQLLLIMIYGFSLLTMFNIQTINNNDNNINSEDPLINREELNLSEEIAINDIDNNLETIINENNELVNFNAKTNQEIELDWEIGVALNVTYGNFLSFPSNFALLSSFNSESQFYRISYAYTTSRALVYKVEIVRHDAKLYIPLHWEYTWDMLIDEETTFYDSVSGGDDSFCINFGTNSDDSEVKLYFRSGNGLGIDYKRENQFLAIEETTCNYFCVSGFERGFSDKWKNHPTSPVDNVEIETTIVSTGRYSLMLNDSDSSTDYYHLTLDQEGNIDQTTLPNGNYYIAFDYYFRSIVSGSVCLSYTDNEGHQQTENLDSTLERVHKAFFYIEIGEFGVYHYLRFKLSAFEGVFYFDNFRIYESKAKFVTTNLNEYTLDYEIISWDNVLNPNVRTNITVNLKIRHNQTLIQSWNFFTCDEGKFSIVYSGNIGFNELEIEIVCWNSWFGYKSYEIFEDLTRWSGNPSNYYSESIENGRLKFVVSDPNYFQLQIYPSNEIDMSYIDYFVFDMETNISSNQLYETVIYINSTHNWKDYTDYLLSTSNQRIIFEKSNWVSGSGNPSKYVFKYTQFYFNDNVNAIIYIDNFHFIQSQKSYLTPKNIEYNNDFPTDNIDFTEGDSDYSDYIGSTTVTIENGLLSSVIIGTVSYPALLDLPEVSSIFTTIIVCYKTNLTIDFRINIKDSADGNLYFNTINAIADIWEIVSFTYSDLTELDDIYFRLTSGSEVFSIDIDYVLITYQDTVSLFETDNYFYTSSLNNTLVSYITSDSNLLNPDSIDLEINILNNSIGNHQLNYTIYNDLDQSDCYIPSQEYSYNYNVVNQTLLVINYLDLLEIHIDTSFTNVMNSLSSLSNQLNTNITTIINMINSLDSSLDSKYSVIMSYLNYITSIIDDLDAGQYQMTNILNSIISMINSLDNNMKNNFSLVLNSFDSLYDSLEDVILAETNEIDATLTTIINSLDLLDSNLANNFTNIMTSLSNIYSNQDNFSIIITNINSLSSQLNSNTTTILNAISNLQSIHLSNMTTLVNNILSLSNQLNINTTTLLNAINDLNVTQQFIYNLQFDQSFNETVREFNMTSPTIVKTENSFFVDITIWNNYTGSDITIIWQNNLGEIVKSEYLGKAIITNNSLLLSINALEIEGNYTITIMLTNEYLVAFSQTSITLEYNLSKANSDTDNFFALGVFILILVVIFLLVRNFYKKF